MTFFLDIAPEPSGVGLFAGVAFFLAFAAVAFISYRVLRKTLKMAFRLAIVGVILLVAVAGSLSLWWVSTPKYVRPERPSPVKRR